MESTARSDPPACAEIATTIVQFERLARIADEDRETDIAHVCRIVGRGLNENSTIRRYLNLYHQPLSPRRTNDSPRNPGATATRIAALRTEVAELREGAYFLGRPNSRAAQRPRTSWHATFKLIEKELDKPNIGASSPPSSSASPGRSSRPWPATHGARLSAARSLVGAI